jgi:hypothetical protein
LGGAESGRRARTRRRVGITPLVVAAVIVVIVLVASVSVYYYASGGSPGSSEAKSSSQSLAGGQAGASSASSAHSAATSSPQGSSTASGVHTYSGTFNFSVPLGPSGERVLGNGTVQTYTSVQFATGSFAFSINPQNYTGSGSGRGTLIVTTTGFCSGKVTLPYTFLIPDATDILGGNISVFIGTPTPANFTVNLTCTGPMQGVSTATNNPSPFLSVYPNEMSEAAVPVTVDQHLSGGTTYHYNITQTG